MPFEVFLSFLPLHTQPSGTHVFPSIGDVQPVHFVTYFRYLRFFPDGTCLNLSTTDDPSTVVRRLNRSLRSKGLTIGRWHLNGDVINIYDLEEHALPPLQRTRPGLGPPTAAPPPSNYQMTYKLEMRCQLKSAQRGKM